jgi:CO dehydrogenase maturation factor
VTTPIFAVAGKGGSGKTTLAALLVRGLLERGEIPVLAVDADPAANLGEALGVAVGTTLGSAVEEFYAGRAQVPPGMTKEALLEVRFASVIDERTGFDLLSMGRGEGPGCYCSVNNTLRALVERLTGSYRVVVIDNEAGLEHLSRRTARRIDVLVVVSDFAVRGLRTARDISGLVDELGLDVGARMLVVSRAPADPAARAEALPRLLAAAGDVGLELGGVVPHDDAVVAADLERSGLLRLSATSPAVAAASEIIDRAMAALGGRP